MFKTKKAAALLLALALLFALAACGQAEAGDVWAKAEYGEDAELGEGAAAISVAVTADGKTVTFTVHTDADNLRGALEPLGLISGEESELGLYIKTVNGISADYEADGYYWALYIDGEYAMTGVDATPVTDGGEYALVREAA